MTLEEEFKNNISQINHIKLCEIIATYRYIGVMKDQAVASMVELATRRETGDGFDYETKITEIISGLPKINLDLKSVIGSFTGFKF